MKTERKRRRIFAAVSFLKNNFMKQYDSRFDTTDETTNLENSFFDEASDMFDSQDNFFEGEITHGEPDNFLRRSSKKVAKSQARKMARVTNRNERKAARKSRVELKADRNAKAAETDAKSELLSVSPSTVALSDVQTNQPLVASYVAQQGMIPQTNPAALALQATEAYQNNVQSYSDSVPDFENAEEAYIDDAIEDWQGEEGEAEEFFGSVITSVIKAGSELITKINEKRTSNGKQPLFAGKNWKKLAEKYNKNEEVVTDGLTAAEKAFLVLTKKEIDEKKKESALGAATGAFVDDQKRQGLKEYLPLIIGAAIIIFVIGKKS